MQGLVLALLLLLGARMAEAYQARFGGGSMVGSLRSRALCRRRGVVQHVKMGLASAPTGSSEFDAIRGLDVVSAADGKSVRLGELWEMHETVILLTAEVVPIIETSSVKLVCIGIGTHQRSLDFSAHTGFDRKYLFSDEENKVYDALNLVKSTPATLFTDARTPLALLKRIREKKTSFLANALSSWSNAMWIPPRLEQGLQQGGAFVFQGHATIFSFRDPSAGAHVSLDELIRVALNAADSN